MYLGTTHHVSAWDVARVAAGTVIVLLGILLAGGLQAWAADGDPDVGFAFKREFDVPVQTIWTMQERENTTQRGAIAFSPDGSLVASGRSDSNDVEIRSSADGTLVRVLTGLNNNANVIRFSPDGQYLATGTGQSGQNLSLNLWRVSDGIRLVGRIPAFTNGTISVSFSPDGQLLIASGFHATGYKVYHVPDMTLVSTVGNFDPELGYNVRINAVEFSRDGQFIAVGATRGLYIRNASDGSLVRLINTNAPYAMPVNSVAFSPNGVDLAAATGSQSTATGPNICTDCVIKLFRFGDGTLLHTYNDPAVPTFAKLNFSPNGRILGAGYADFNGTSYSGAAQFWSVASGSSLRRDARDFWVQDLAYSPLGTTYAFFGADGVIAVVQAPTDVMRRKKPMIGSD
jgi:WD40 repeat protein